MQVKITTGELLEVRDYAEASAECRKFLDDAGIGNSQWNGGALWEGNKWIGYVSFNGRVWAGTAREWKPGMKPLYDPR